MVACVVLTLFESPVALPAGLQLSQKHSIRHEIDQLEDAWRTALLNGNTTVMEGLLADDYLAITPSGTLQNKEQTLENLRQGRTQLHHP